MNIRCDCIGLPVFAKFILLEKAKVSTFLLSSMSGRTILIILDKDNVWPHIRHLRLMRKNFRKENFGLSFRSIVYENYGENALKNFVILIEKVVKGLFLFSQPILSLYNYFYIIFLTECFFL